MDAIIEKFLDLQPFGWIFQRLGVGDKWSAFLSLVFISLFTAGIVKLYQFLLKHYNFKKAALADIKPQFDHLSIKKARRFYIQTQYQNASPARQDEPGFTHKYIARDKLIPFFIETAFNEEIDSERFYLILADSGMGKTTFMINLYMSYTSRFSRKKDDIKLLRFSNPDMIGQIKAISLAGAKKTILLLDALDEDPGIISTDPNVSDAQAFQKRIDEIIDITRNFKEVVITCRTQYFPGQEKDPYELKVKRPDERGLYTLNKLYISPFNEKEVKSYLNRKFGIIPFINQKKKRRALRIVSQSRNLVMRPMLLSYIDYLIEDEMVAVNTCNIYETLVDKWLLREAEKRTGIAGRAGFIKNLRELSMQIAIAIHANWKQDGRMSVSKEEAVETAKLFEIDLRPNEITGQSLLTCDGVGNWKFAHKSIFEFFLAKEAHRNPRYIREMNFKGMDMAKKFYEEMNPDMFVEDLKVIYNNGWEISHEINSPFLIQRKVLNNRNFISLLFDNGPDIDQTSFYEDFRLTDLLIYCNKMNTDNGYSPAYNIPDGELTLQHIMIRNLSQFQGYRLPTENELRCHYLNKFKTHYNPEQFSMDSKTFKIIMRGKDGGETKVEDIPGGFEWCHSGGGIASFSRDLYYFTLLAKSNSSVTDCVKKVPLHLIENRRYTARLVYIP